MALALTPVFIDFFSRVAAGELEIYNEFSLQHEFGIFLRSVLLGYRVEFERPVGFYGLQRTASFGALQTSASPSEREAIAITSSANCSLCARRCNL
jgi:hypothetical protein